MLNVFKLSYLEQERNESTNASNQDGFHRTGKLEQLISTISNELGPVAGGKDNNYIYKPIKHNRHQQHKKPETRSGTMGKFQPSLRVKRECTPLRPVVTSVKQELSPVKQEFSRVKREFSPVTKRERSPVYSPSPTMDSHSFSRSCSADVMIDIQEHRRLVDDLQSQLKEKDLTMVEMIVDHQRTLTDAQSNLADSEKRRRQELCDAAAREVNLKKLLDGKMAEVAQMQEKHASDVSEMNQRVGRLRIEKERLQMMLDNQRDAVVRLECQKRDLELKDSQATAEIARLNAQITKQLDRIDSMKSFIESDIIRLRMSYKNSGSHGPSLPKSCSSGVTSVNEFQKSIDKIRLEFSRKNASLSHQNRLNCQKLKDENWDLEQKLIKLQAEKDSIDREYNDLKSQSCLPQNLAKNQNNDNQPSGNLVASEHSQASAHDYSNNDENSVTNLDLNEKNGSLEIGNLNSSIIKTRNSNASDTNESTIAEKDLAKQLLGKRDLKSQNSMVVVPLKKNKW